MKDKLIGRKIKSLKLSSGESYLLFDTDEDQILWEAEGDCCSESWFADIINFAALIDGTVISVEDIDLPDAFVQKASEDNRCRQLHDNFYGIRIATDLGICDIVYRNSSNGYYGGWYSEVIYKKSVAKSLKKIVFRELNGDFP